MSNQSALANQLAYAHGQDGWEAVAKVVEGMVAAWHVGEPPRRTDRQYIAMAIDMHGGGHGKPSDDPRWCVVQWGNRFCGGVDPYWESSSPGYSTRVLILKWADLPELDRIGRVRADRAEEIANG